MTGREDRRITALDAYIRTQLVRAAESHASHIDTGAWLEAALRAKTHDEHDDTATADS